jgi:hypothetical protein
MSYKEKSDLVSNASNKQSGNLYLNISHKDGGGGAPSVKKALSIKNTVISTRITNSMPKTPVLAL